MEETYGGHGATEKVWKYLSLTTDFGYNSSFFLWKGWRGLICYNGSQDSSVGIVMGYRLDGQSTILSKGKGSFSLHIFQTGSGPHPASYPVGTGGGGALPPRVKRLGHEADLLPPSVAKVKNDIAVPQLPLTSSWNA
jgi:hypothetical protein